MTRRLGAAVVTLAGLAAALLLAGQIGLLRGTPPADLGVRDGLLKPPSTTPNSVSSQAARHPGHPRAQDAAIEPLRIAAADPETALAAVRRAVEATPGATVVIATPGYLRVTFETRWLRFVDDAEFWWDAEAGVVQVRSASRLGASDLGVNRARIENLRAELAR